MSAPGYLGEPIARPLALHALDTSAVRGAARDRRTRRSRHVSSRSSTRRRSSSQAWVSAWLAVLAVLATAAIACGPPARGLSAPVADPEVGVRAALSGFLTAFENLAWESFRASFAEDACVFFPSARTPERFCGRRAIEARFAQVFDQERRAAASGPPYLQLHPEELAIQLVGTTGAIASFLLRNQERVARRTIVFRNDQGRWRIVHLHGSNVPWPDAPR